MDTVTMIRVVAAVLAVILLAIVISQAQTYDFGKASDPEKVAWKRRRSRFSIRPGIPCSASRFESPARVLAGS